MKERDAIKRFTEVMDRGRTGSWEHVRKIFEDAAGGPIPWDPEEPRRITTIPFGRSRQLATRDNDGVRVLTANEHDEAAARWNAVERFCEQLRGVTVNNAGYRLIEFLDEERVRLR